MCSCSIFPIDGDETYDSIDLEENGLVINPTMNKLYAIGTDLQSGISNL